MPLGNIYLIAVRIQIKDTRKRMLAAAKDYKQLKCPSTDYSLKKLPATARWNTSDVT